MALSAGPILRQWPQAFRETVDAPSRNRRNTDKPAVSICQTRNPARQFQLHADATVIVAPH